MKQLPIALLLLSATVLAQAPKKDEAVVCTPATIEQNCKAVHDYYTAKFVSSVGFGYERMPAVQEAISDHQWQVGLDNYVVKNIQLVSLLKHNPPVVYPPVTQLTEFNHHRTPPVAEKKDGVEPRPLNEFEVAALKQLTENKDKSVVPGGTIMVGALRAETSCLKCHDCEEGAILGAFSYTLVKQPLKTEVESRDTKVASLVPDPQAGTQK